MRVRLFLSPRNFRPTSVSSSSSDWRAGWALQGRRGAGPDRVLPFCPLPHASSVAPVWSAQGAPSPITFTPTLGTGPLEVSSQPSEAPYFWKPPRSAETPSSIPPPVVPLPLASLLQPITDSGRNGGQGERQSWQRTQQGQVMGEEARSAGERKKGKSS